MVLLSTFISKRQGCNTREEVTSQNSPGFSGEKAVKGSVMRKGGWRGREREKEI